MQNRWGLMGPVGPDVADGACRGRWGLTGPVEPVGPDGAVGA